MRQMSKKRLALFMVLALLTGCMADGAAVGSNTKASEDGRQSYGLHDPRKEMGTKGIDKVTWDCVYFGSYWQSDTNGDGVADQRDEKEPIKWRVLSVDGSSALLLADQCLDWRSFCEGGEGHESCAWSKSGLRSWLNGYGMEENWDGADYTDKGFLNDAFTSAEQSAIKVVQWSHNYIWDDVREEHGETSDKVNLLRLHETRYSRYGFFPLDRGEKARMARNTAYVEQKKRMPDSQVNTAGGGEYADWWLRTAAEDYSYGDGFRYVDVAGTVVSKGRSMHECASIRPAVYLDLSSGMWSPAGTICSDGSEGQTAPPAPTTGGAENDYGVHSPKIQIGDIEYLERAAEWDSIYFGSYWQNDTNGDGVADQKDEKEPIKWKVLFVDGDDAFLLADQCLDVQKFSGENKADVKFDSWDKSGLRSWLNGYGAEENAEGKDYADDNFLDSAFTSAEQLAIRAGSILNYTGDEECEYLESTTDKVFLLALHEAREFTYGFLSLNFGLWYRVAAKTGYAEQRRLAVGLDEGKGEGKENGDWWLRTQGEADGHSIRFVDQIGRVVRAGQDAREYALVRPALHLDLSSSVWTLATESPSAAPTPTVTPTAEPTVTPDVETEPIQTPSPSITPPPVTEDPSAMPSPSITPPLVSEGPSAAPVLTALPPTQTPAVTKEEQEKADQFVEQHVTDPNGKIIIEVTDMTRDIIISGEDSWEKLTGQIRRLIDERLREAGGRYIYEQLLKMAKAYKIPGFKVVKFMKKNTKAKLKMMKCNGAVIVCLSSNKKVATINKKGVIRAKKPGRATLTFAAVKGIHTNRLVIDLRVKKKFKNAKELTNFKSKVIQTPTVLVAKKRLLNKSSKIRVYDLQKTSKVGFIPIRKKILSIDRKGKYTGKKRGSTLVRVKIHQNKKDYLLYVYVTIH